MRRIIWTHSARRDFERIDDWYRDTAPDHAAEVGDAAIGAGRFLQQFPFAGAKTSRQMLRKWPVPDTDFRLFYRVTRTAIEIVRICHAREDWDKLA